MSPRDRATAVTITNEGDDELVMQADVYRWAQKPSGEDDLALSEDLILSLPVFITPPNLKRELQCSARRQSADALAVTCDNTGRVYAQPRSLELSLAS